MTDTQKRLIMADKFVIVIEYKTTYSSGKIVMKEALYLASQKKVLTKLKDCRITSILKKTLEEVIL